MGFLNPINVRVGAGETVGTGVMVGVTATVGVGVGVSVETTGRTVTVVDPVPICPKLSVTWMETVKVPLITYT